MEQNPVYLVMVTESNNNKFYKMIPHGDTFTVEYGRVGVSSVQTDSYPMSKWNSKYNEKVRKGYVDQTEIHKDEFSVKTPAAKVRDGYAPISNPSIRSIVDRLQQMAKQTVQQNYTISSNKVTQAMVDRAQVILNELTFVKDLTFFNDVLLKLFTVIPRKMGVVSDHLAKSPSDFLRIISKEQDLLDVMKGQVVQHAAEVDDAGDESDTKESSAQTILDAMGLTFAEATPMDIVAIKSSLGEISDRFYQAWCVTNAKTQDRFNKFLAGSGVIDTKLLFHGSRSENWWSIINNGLVIRPTNAVLTGSMFGHGIYYAPKAKKSLGYTSVSGSYWAGGSAPSGFMGLYNVAYGKPFDVYDSYYGYGNFSYDMLQQKCPGANCLHAHAGSALYNDEIIIYKAEQCTIRYLIEIK